MKLGRLTEVDVRELWKHEQYDFSNWLAEEENIELLNDIIGLTLVNIQKEVYVGAYRCDLVAEDETTGTTVIIENQLECSNHDHLGKIITYASGLNAKVIVWIVKEAREEHRSAIEWLNNNTNADLGFFLIELHAYKIGNSDCAPKFEAVEIPNGFIKNGKNNIDQGELNKSQAERLEFWNMLNEYVTAQGKPFSIRKAPTKSWYVISIGTSEAFISITLANKESYVGVELYIHDNKTLFDSLYSKKDIIEQEIGFIFDWQRLDNKKASRILHKINGLNFDDHSNYPELMNSIIDKVTVMKKTFAKYI